MELEMKKVRHGYYEALSLASMSCETMREHIVPDSCADIARIVETTGQVLISGREVIGEGRFCASGTVDVSILYIPEKGPGPCVLRVQLPFQCCSDGQWNDGAEFPDVRGELQSIDARLLNPRKILARANVVLYPSAYLHVSRSLCVDAPDEERVELLHCEKMTHVVSAVREKEFTFLEEIPLSQGRGGAEEILGWRVDIRGTDCKLIGTKLVLKGIASATVLYRETGGSPEVNRCEFPFSQILDGSSLQEDWEFDSCFHTLNSDCRIGTESGADDRHILTLTMLLRARVTVRRNEQIRFIADLYGIDSNITCSTEDIKLCEDSHKYSKRFNIRETLETGAAVKSVLDVEIRCGNVHMDNKNRMLEIPIHARCIYVDENDSLHSVRHEFSSRSPLEHESDLESKCRAVCCGDIMTGILPDGIELRFPIECMIEAEQVSTCKCVSGGEKEAYDDDIVRPSLVLRRIGTDESLWSVAKTYRTTCRSILEINELSDEHQIPHDRLMLIPCRR